MSVSGVGSVNSYIYNMKTGRLSTKDGQRDEFVDYFNDELDGKDSAALNGFDQQRKGSVKKMIDTMKSGMVGKNVMGTLREEEIEIIYEMVDATTSVYSVNGEKVFIVNTAVSYTPKEISILGQCTIHIKLLIPLVTTP